MTFRLLCAGSKPVLPKGGLEIFQMGTLPRWAPISSKWFCNSVELVDNPRWGYIYKLISENKVKYYEAITWYRKGHGGHQGALWNWERETAHTPGRSFPGFRKLWWLEARWGGA